MSWNISINLLRGGDMQNGWRLYHGLQVPANIGNYGNEAFETYSIQEVPVLSDLNEAQEGKSLLVGEQGVGDSMMFARVAEVLLEVNAKAIFADKRLVPIYSRSSNAHAVERLQNG